MRIVSENEVGERMAGVSRELDAAQLGRAVARRKLWILLPTLLCCLAAAVGVNMVKPRYTAEAKILLENQENFFTRPDRSDTATQATLPDDEAVQSQVQLVTSRDVARTAIKQLDLARNPEFDAAAGGLGPVSRLLVLLGLERDPLRSGVEDRLLTSYFDRLNVYPITKSRVLSVQFTSVDPDLAAKAANTISDLYIGLQSDAKRDGAKSAADSLASLIADLRVKVAAADTKAQSYRARNGLLVGANNTTITSQQLSDMTTQLAQARNAEAESEAKAKLLRDMIRQNRITDVPDVANSDLIRRISEQRIALKAQIAQQAITLLPGHPRMREMSAQLADLDAQLRLAAEKVVRTLENDARIAASRVDNLRATLDTQKQTATTATVDQVTLNELEQQARLLKDQLDFNTQKYQEAHARENAMSAPADARVISRAIAPELPSFPKKVPTIAIFTLAGLLLSIGTVIARELMSGRAFVAEPVGLREASPMPVPVAVPVPVPAAEPAPAAAVADVRDWPVAASTQAAAVRAEVPAQPVDALRPTHHPRVMPEVPEPVAEYLPRQVEPEDSHHDITSDETAMHDAALFAEPVSHTVADEYAAHVEHALPTEPAAPVHAVVDPVLDAPTHEHASAQPAWHRWDAEDEALLEGTHAQHKPFAEPAMQAAADETSHLPAVPEPAAAVDHESTHDEVPLAAEPAFEGPEPEWAAMLDMVADREKSGGGVRLLVLRSADAAVVAPEGALALARGLSRRSRVILVDCGFDEGLDRLLVAPRAADAPPVLGLRNLLAGDTSFAEVIHRDPRSRLHIVPFGTGSGETSEEELGMLIDALAETYDHVVMAVPAVGDNGVIRAASQGDIAILFVTEETAQEVIDHHRLMLHKADVPSVYVLDVAELAAAPDQDRHSAAA